MPPGLNLGGEVGRWGDGHIGQHLLHMQDEIGYNVSNKNIITENFDWYRNKKYPTQQANSESKESQWPCGEQCDISLQWRILI